MNLTKERWGERTILRVEDKRQGESSLELILRFRKDPRPVDLDEIKKFLGDVIKELNGEETGLTKYRRVQHSSPAVGKKKSAWKKNHRERLEQFITEMSESLTERGKQNLARYLAELAGGVEK